MNCGMAMIDFKQGKSIRQGNHLHRVYLCAIIDDASRLLVGYEWGLNEDTTLFARAFKKAVAIYGAPKFYIPTRERFFAPTISWSYVHDWVYRCSTPSLIPLNPKAKSSVLIEPSSKCSIHWSMILNPSIANN